MRTPTAEAAREPLSALDAARRRRRAKRHGARAGAAATAVGKKGPPGLGFPPFPLPPPLTKPADDVTALELPFRLLLSPRSDAAWAHEAAPYSAGADATSRTELWHTRLGARALGDAGEPAVSEEAGATLPMRAIWTRDPGFDPANPVKKLSTPTLDSPTSITLADFFEKPLSAQDRADIVHQSSNYEADVEPVMPLKAKRVMLTALGGWLDVHGEWGFSSTTNLISWDHRATQGRDQYVRIERAYYADTTHKMVLVIITERLLKPEAPFTAYLWKRAFVLCREPVVTFAAPTGDLSVRNMATRRMPFRTIELKTLVTPNLNPMPLKDSKPPPEMFVPQIDGGVPLLFEFEGTDWEGNVVPFRKPIAMMRAEGGEVDPDAFDDARDALKDLAFDVDFGGRRIALAPATVGDLTRVDDTTYEVTSARFGLAVHGSTGQEVPFSPVFEHALVTVEAVRHLSQGGGPCEVKFAEVYTDYGFGAANAGEVMLALSAPQTVAFSSSSERSGGFLTPDMNITGVSRKNGPVAGDLATIATDTFAPADFFGALGSAKLFGTFPLTAVIKSVGAKLDQAPKFMTQALDDASAILADITRVIRWLNDLGLNPGGTVGLARSAADGASSGGLVGLAQSVIDGLSSGDPAATLGLVGNLVAALDDLIDQLGRTPLIETLPDGARRELARRAALLRGALDGAFGKLVDFFEAYQKAEELAKNLTVNLEWRTELVPERPKDPIFVPGPGGSLLLGVEVRGKATATKPAGVDLSCSLENFSIELIAPARFMTLHFTKLQFRIADGKKPDIDVVFGGIEFVGPLSFIEKLKSVIPLDGFSDPPNLDVTAEGIVAGYTLPIPNVAVGIFSLENVAVGAAFKVPFVGASPLSVRFFFCTREAPFTLTVCMLGGGGFFGVELTLNGVRLIEGALEFGASLSVDFGVASGGVSIMAGIYFKWEDDRVQLSGYFRIRGEVDVLGLIRASIELYLELSYLAVEGQPGKVWGVATIEIEVEMCFFSFYVPLRAEKRFSGSNEDPTFADVMGPCNLLTEPTCDPSYMPWNDYVGAYD